MLSRIPFVCPADLLAKARAATAVATAVVSAGNAVAIESARRATEEGLIVPTLVGAREAIEAAARAVDWDIAGIRIVEADGEPATARAAVALARSGEVAALMKGQVHTDALLRAVVDRELGLRTGRRLSHIFHMTAPERDGAICITDAAVNVRPDVGQMIDIVNNAVGLLHALGNAEPRVAALSGTEQETAAMPSSVDAAEVARRAQAGEVRGAVVEGPFALDNAVSPEAAAIKGIDGPVAGRADLLLVPNIETGNALFKAMVYFMSATAAGLVLGARVPIVLTSRADPPEARLAATALAAILARHEAGA